MKQESRAIIQEQLKHIPSKVRDAFLHINSSQYIKTLSEKNNLRTDQAGVLEDELMLVLLGLESPDTFMNNLVREGNISKDTANAIVRDINTDVFEKIRHDLAEFHRQSWDRYGTNTIKDVFDTKSPAQNQNVIYPQKPGALNVSVPPNLPVETPASTQRGSVAGTDFAQQKMEQAFRMPSHTTRVVEQAPAVSGMPPLKQQYSGRVDPYREAIQ